MPSGGAGRRLSLGPFQGIGKSGTIFVVGSIEKSLGRVRVEYHGARTMDIDVLVCEGFTSDTDTLTVPHPHIRERAFVMVPLSDLFPQHQALGYDFHQAYEEVDKSGVSLYK